MRTSRSRLNLLVILFAALALLAVGCGGDDSGSSSTSTTSGATTTTSGNAGAIRALQSELDTLGCGAGATDGKLGPETEAAIRHFQAAAGLTVDGIVGVNTRSALTAAAQSGAPNCTNTPQPLTTAATTTTRGGSAPPCTEQAIASGLQAGSTGDSIGQFECSGNWAFAEVTTPGEDGFEFTALLQWNGSAWVSVDRATYCENGSVPQNIFQPACESN